VGGESAPRAAGTPVSPRAVNDAGKPNKGCSAATVRRVSIDEIFLVHFFRQCMQATDSQSGCSPAATTAKTA
jgi:hypothetical protein